MTWKIRLLGTGAGAFVGFATAAQPKAAQPVPAPMRDLQWGQLNILHTTDTHGWHGGHLQESQYSADWGDYVSFAQHLRKRADDERRDLLLVDTGDRVEGNGLYDASDPKGKYYYDIYREQDVDVLCTGNHELYQAPTADAEHNKTVPNFQNRYIASNLDYIDAKSGIRIPMAQRYKKFETKNQKLRVVAFGFLFNFTGNANNTVVQSVAETIKEKWFQEAIREKADVFLVIGHVGVRMQEFKDIFAAIRKQNRFSPILFFGGHVHVRDATAYDQRSFAIASGRYFETIGWMSVGGIKTEESSDEVATETAMISFSRRYIDNNLLGLYHHTGLNETTFPTVHGKKVTKMIADARKALDLDYRYGCAPQNYWTTRAPYPDSRSIYTWLENEVLPDVVFNETRQDVPRLAIMNTGAVRFDIFQGAFTRDTTYIISPFLNRFVSVHNVPYDVASKVIQLLNKGGPILDSTPGMEAATFMASPEHVDAPVQTATQQEQMLRTDFQHATPAHYDISDLQKPLGRRAQQPELIGGYTTTDDMGTDGDDAVHTPIKFYQVPNCIKAEIGFSKKEPKTVDLVFFDFIEEWVLLALNLSGGDYSKADVVRYLEPTFSDLLHGWIRKNWRRDC